MSVPPGIIHLLRLLPLVFIYPAVTYGVLELGQVHFDTTVPRWIKALACILALPVVKLLQDMYTQIQIKRDAAARGAVLAPQVQGSGFSNVRKVAHSFGEGYPGEALLEWCQQYGETFRIPVIGGEKFFTTEPEYIKAILATQFNNFVKGSTLFDMWSSLLGAGVFNSDGDIWKFHRGMTRPFFNKDRISDFENFDRHATDAITQIKGRLAEGYPVEFQDVVARFTLDSASEFLFGKDVCSLSAGLPYPETSRLANSSSFVNHPSNSFVRAFFDAQDWAARRVRYGPLWRLFEFWKDEVKPLRDVINEYIDPIMAETLAAKEIKKKGGLTAEKVQTEEGSLLEQLVEHTEDYRIVQDELINTLVAGRDTTAGTLTFAVYKLSAHPEITKRLREEISQTVGFSRAPTYDDIRNMKYLRAYLNEVLRLYPIVPNNNRSAVEATTFPSKTGKAPIYIAKGTHCSYSVFLMHRRKDLWGPDADEFDPDRFIDERLNKYLTKNPFIFLPFNAGPRICLGQQFAYNEMSFFLIRLLQSFSEFSLAPDAQPESSKPPASWAGCAGTKGKDTIRFRLSLTMSAREGLWVRMKEASSHTETA